MGRFFHHPRPPDIGQRLGFGRQGTIIEPFAQQQRQRLELVGRFNLFDADVSLGHVGLDRGHVVRRALINLRVHTQNKS